MTTHKPRTIGFIFARGGSKGVPGKNIRPLAGKPLIAYAIETARSCSAIETVIVSTDEPAIADVARAHGAEVPFLRPQELAADDSPEWLSWQHAIRWVQANRGDFDIFISLPTTSPFRTPQDVAACLDALDVDPAADAVITVRDAERNPYFNIVSIDDGGYAHLLMQPEKAFSRRQDAPVVFDITTVAYAARPAFVLAAQRLFEGKVRTVRVPTERGMDIDTPYDFMLAECVARHRFRQTEG